MAFTQSTEAGMEVASFGNNEGPTAPLADAAFSGRRFLGSIAGTGGANVLIAVLGVVVGIVIARELGASVRGNIVIVMIWPGFITTFGCLGITVSACYWVAAQHYRRRELVAAATIISLTIGAVIAVAGFFAAPLIKDTPDVLSALRLTFVLMSVGITGGTLIGVLQATRTVLWNVARIAQPAAYGVGVLGLMLTSRLSFTGVVRVMVFATTLQTVLAAMFVLHTVGSPSRPGARDFKNLLGYGVRHALAGAPWLVNQRLDQLVLSLVASPAALGNYAIAVMLSTLATPFVEAFGAVAFPRMAAAGSERERRLIQRTALRGSVLTAVAVLFPTFLLSGWIVHLLFGTEFADAVLPSRILASAAVLLAYNQIAENVLNGRGRPLAAAVAEGIGTAVTVALLLVLVPLWGINGAAVTAVLAYGVVAVFLRITLNRIGGRGGAA